MKTRTIAAVMAVALAVIFCLYPTSCSSGRPTVASSDELKQFIAYDFGTTLVSTLLFEGRPFEEYYLLEPIRINTVHKIKHPNIIIPVANQKGEIQYTYVIGTMDEYVSSMSSQNAPLWNEVLKYDSENVILYQDEHKVYAQVQDKIFLQKLDGSVEMLSEDQVAELRKKFKRVTLVSTSFRKSEELTAAAVESYRNARS